MPRDNNGVVGSGYGTSYCAVGGGWIGFGIWLRALVVYFCFGELIDGGGLLASSFSILLATFFLSSMCCPMYLPARTPAMYIGHTSNNTFELRQ